MAWQSLRDRLDRLANPVLVKEMYQSLHNRKFLAGLWLLLLGVQVTYILVYMGESGRDCGDQMFQIFIIFTALMGAAVLPYLTYENLSEEIKGRTIELIHLTRMDARKQVRGRLLAAVVKIGILFAVVGPFAVASFLFKGIGVESILASLYFILLLSIFVASLALFFAALTACNEMRTVARVGFLLLLLWVVAGLFAPIGLWLSGPFLFGFGALRAGSSPDWVLVLAQGADLAVMMFLLVSLFSAAAANTLTFEADKCSGRTKFFLLLVLPVYCASIIVPGWIDHGAVSADAMTSFVRGAVILLTICSAFWLTGPDRVARRVQRKLKERDLVAYDVLWFPFTDGAGSSAAYFLIALALIFGLTYAASLVAVALSTDIEQGDIAFPLVVYPIYILYLAAISRGIVRLLPARFRTAKMLRGVFLVLFALNILIAGIWAAGPGLRGDREPSLLKGIFPVAYLVSVERPGDELGWVPALLVPGLVGFLFHAVVMTRRFRRFVSGQYD